MSQSAFERIYEGVKQILHGQVATYGQVAAIAEIAKSIDFSKGS